MTTTTETQKTESAQPVAPLSYTYRSAFEATGISISTLRVDAAKGVLKTRKRGRKVVILARDLQAYLDALPA